MKTASFPDITPTLAKMKIHDHLSLIHDNTLLGTVIQFGLRNKSLDDLCKIILGQYQDDPKDVLFVVGEETINLIKRIYFL